MFLDRQLDKASTSTSDASWSGMHSEHLIFATDSNNRNIVLGSGAFGEVRCNKSPRQWPLTEVERDPHTCMVSTRAKEMMHHLVGR
jgi:hypothetical protein